MKLLLDENLPHQLRNELPGHDCFTVAYMGWAGLENGKMLAAAAGNDFDALLTKDANLQYEQNLVSLPVSVVILNAPNNDIEDIRPLIPSFSGFSRRCRLVRWFMWIVLERQLINAEFAENPCIGRRFCRQ